MFIEDDWSACPEQVLTMSCYNRTKKKKGYITLAKRTYGTDWYLCQYWIPFRDNHATEKKCTKKKHCEQKQSLAQNWKFCWTGWSQTAYFFDDTWETQCPGNIRVSVYRHDKKLNNYYERIVYLHCLLWMHPFFLYSVFKLNVDKVCNKPIWNSEFCGNMCHIHLCIFIFSSIQFSVSIISNISSLICYKHPFPQFTNTPLSSPLCFVCNVWYFRPVGNMPAILQSKSTILNHPF